MPTFRTLLVPVDLSPNSWPAFRVARALARQGRARLIVLHVVEQVHCAEQPVLYDEPGLPIAPPEGYQGHHEALKERLHELYAPDGGVRVEYQLRDGAAAEEILDAAEESGCDLIVIGTHVRTGWGRLLLGSVAEAVMRGARCPVLTIKPTRSHPSPSPACEAVAM
jgi:nucleotide-binding universal stress UspA family protein